MQKKNVTVIGLGRVGGYFGFKISRFNESANTINLTFVVRPQTLEVISKDGLTLLSEEFNDKTTAPDALVSEISKIPTPDLVMICVKEYDLESVCRKVLEVITPDTIILPLMNGADIYERIREIIPKNPILPSCVYVASHLKSRGVVEHKGKPGKLFLGRDPLHFSHQIDWVLDLLVQSNIDLDFKDDVQVEIWKKFIFISSFGMVTAKYNSSIGTVCTDEEQRREATEIMEEIKQVAEKKGVILPADIILQTFQKAATFPPETPTSLQLDINSSKNNTEIELLSGSVIKLAENYGIAVPKTQKIYKDLKSIILSKQNSD